VLIASLLRIAKQRYSTLISDAAKGNKKINVATLKPHQIVSKFLNGFPYHLGYSAAQMEQHEMDLLNAQWLNYVNMVKECGSLTSTLAVVDVSGSMNGTPMEVATALGLLCSEVSNSSHSLGKPTESSSSPGYKPSVERSGDYLLG
jgi:hypothetical protein